MTSKIFNWKVTTKNDKVYITEGKTIIEALLPLEHLNIKRVIALSKNYKRNHICFVKCARCENKGPIKTANVFQGQWVCAPCYIILSRVL